MTRARADRRRSQGGVESAARYDGFISYSHAVDGKLAPVLQTEVERFARPWHRPRARRVFRDQANLAADPHLWGAIALVHPPRLSSCRPVALGGPGARLVARPPRR
jgi:hypothetical protein